MDYVYKMIISDDSKECLINSMGNKRYFTSMAKATDYFSKQVDKHRLVYNITTLKHSRFYKVHDIDMNVIGYINIERETVW